MPQTLSPLLFLLAHIHASFVLFIPSCQKPGKDGLRNRRLQLGQEYTIDRQRKIRRLGAEGDSRKVLDTSEGLWH
jgi:hypothetical protein